MNVTVFGAAGGIGKHIVERSLSRGYTVRAFLRDKDTLAITHPNLVVVRGDITNYAQVKSALEGGDVVVNFVGIPIVRHPGELQMLDGTKNIIKAMKELGMKRYISWSTPQIRSPKDSGIYHIVRIVGSIFFELKYKQSRRQLTGIADEVMNSGLDWTLVRFMKLSDAPYTGDIVVTFGEKKNNFLISKDDVAAFTVAQIESRDFIQNMPIIGTPK